MKHRTSNIASEFLVSKGKNSDIAISIARAVIRYSRLNLFPSVHEIFVDGGL